MDVRVHLEEDEEQECYFEGCHKRVPIEESYCRDCWSKIRGGKIYYAKDLDDLEIRVNEAEGIPEKSVWVVLQDALINYLKNGH